MNFSVSTKKLPQSRVEFSIEVPWEEWQGEIEHTVKRIAGQQKFEGFRPGKAPRAVVEKHVGKETLLNKAAEHALKHIYPEALKREKINAIGRPEVSTQNIAERETLRSTVKTTVVPEITLNQWKAAVKKVNADFMKKEIIIPDDEVESELQRLAESRAKSVTVNREARTGDEVEIDFDVTQDGVPIEGGSSRKHHMVLGKGVFIPGFEEQLLGLKAGDEKTFELTFPTEYHAKHLAGKPATFHVTVTVVQEREVPVLDDAFAQSLGQFKDLNALKENFRSGMLKEQEEKAREERRVNIIEALVKAATVELPQLLIDEELAKMFNELEYHVQGAGMELSEYLKQMKKTKEELFKGWRLQAESRVKSALALEHLAKEQEIEPTNEEVEKEMNQTLQQYRDVKDIEKNVDMERLYQFAKGRLQNEKVFEYLEKLK